MEFIRQFCLIWMVAMAIVSVFFCALTYFSGRIDNTVRGCIGSVVPRFEQLDKRVDTMIENMLAGTERIRLRIAEIDENIARIDAHIAQMDERLVRLETTVK